MRFEDFPVSRVGHELQLIGGVWGDGQHSYVLLFPEDQDHRGFPIVYPYETVAMTPDDWQVLLRQSDLMETEVLAKAADGTVVKAVVRKAERQIGQEVSWQVFKRDGYKCRYCGRDDVPLTVDHLVLWEEGGPSTPDNLVSACRKCNKARGRTQYEDWLKGDYYRRVKGGLLHAEQAVNELLVAKLPLIPRLLKVRSR